MRQIILNNNLSKRRLLLFLMRAISESKRNFVVQNIWFISKLIEFYSKNINTISKILFKTKV